jgi:hypothetical protein
MGGPFLPGWQKRYFSLYPNRIEWRGEQVHLLPGKFGNTSDLNVFYLYVNIVTTNFVAKCNKPAVLGRCDFTG